MPRTRNQCINNIFNGMDWPLCYDQVLMRSIYVHTKKMENLESVEVFNGVLVIVTKVLQERISKNITLEEVKLRVHALRKRFYAFLIYISSNGVKFNPCSKELKVDMPLFTKDEAETMEERWFRVNGFPLYDTCMVVFHFKNVAPVDFSGMPGYNIDEPLVIDDGEEKEDEVNIGAQEAKKDKAVEATANEVGGSVGADIGGSMVVYVGGSVGADVGGSVGEDKRGSMVVLVHVGGSVGADVGGSVYEDVGDSEEEDAGGSVEEDVGDSEEEGSINSNNSFIM